MSADFISKEAVFDARIAQATPSRYAVKKGGAAVTNTPFRAVASTTSQITFTVNVPSQQVFLDRAVELVASANFRFDVRCVTPQPLAGANEPVFVFGRDGALQALPIHSMVSTLTCVINDTSVVTDLGTVMRELLRLTDYAANRKIKTAPTYLDLYYNNNDGYGAVNNPNGGFFDAVSSDLLPNGAWFDFVWCNPDTGSPLNVSAVAASYTVGANTVYFINGVPIRTDAGIGAEPSFYPVAIQFRTSEFLMCSPLIFADSHEESTGLFGLNNLQVILNLKSDVSRTIRSVESAGRLIGRGGTVAPYNFGSLPGLVASKPFDSAVLNCMMISPSLDIPLPSVSMVPWSEFPRYISTGETMGAGMASTTISTNSLTVPVVPDLLVIYAKPQADPTLTQGDYYLPIDQISLNFDKEAHDRCFTVAVAA